MYRLGEVLVVIQFFRIIFGYNIMYNDQYAQTNMTKCESLNCSITGKIITNE